MVRVTEEITQFNPCIMIPGKETASTELKFPIELSNELNLEMT